MLNLFSFWRTNTVCPSGIAECSGASLVIIKPGQQGEISLPSFFALCGAKASSAARILPTD